MNKQWKLPNLKEAQKRTQTPVNIEHSLCDIPECCKEMGKGKNYFILFVP